MEEKPNIKTRDNGHETNEINKYKYTFEIPNWLHLLHLHYLHVAALIYMCNPSDALGQAVFNKIREQVPEITNIKSVVTTADILNGTALDGCF